MATITITTPGDWDDLTSAGVNNDYVTLNVNGTVTINQTPKFLVNTLTLTKGVLDINGAGATSPINIGIANNIKMGVGSKFLCSEGMWCVGTTAGTPSQVIDFGDYMFKTVIGGSRMPDVAHRVSGLWIESGLKVGFTGGTSIQFPEVNDWIYAHDTVGTNIGRIAGIGTAIGDPTQGTIDLQYWMGTITDPMKMDVRKVIDRQGPLLERIWEGTTGGPITLAKGIFNKFGNVGGYIADHSHYEGLATHGTALLMHMFTQGGASTTGTFHNIYYPLAGGTILAPKVNIHRSSTADITAYRTAAPYTSSFIFYTLVSRVGDIDIRGVNFSNTYCASYNQGVTSLVEKRCSAPAYYSSTLTGTNIVEDCIYSGPWQSFYIPLSAYSVNPSKIKNCLAICSRSTMYPLRIPNANVKLNISDSILMNASSIDSYKKYYGAVISGDPAELSFQDCIIDGNIYYSPAGGTNCFSNTFIRHCNVSSPSDIYVNSVLSVPSFYISNIQNIKSCISTNNNIIDASQKTLNELKMRSIYNPKFVDTQQAYIAYIPNSYINTIDIARCYLTPNRSISGLSNLTKCNSATITDCCLGGTQGISLSSTNLTHSDITFKHLFAGTNYNKICALNSLYYNKGNNWHDQRFSGTEGMITWFNCYNNETNSTENILIETIGTQGYNTLPAAGYIAAGGTFISEMPYFCLGITGFNGTVGHAYDNYRDATYRGKYDWWGTCLTDFQYDTSGDGGTGFNGSWLDLRTPTNLTGLSISPSTGVKLKIRVRTPNLSNPVSQARCLHIHYTLPEGLDYPVLYPIDQVTTTITLRNVVVGSRYYIYNSDSSTLLTSGVASATTVTYSVNSTSADNGDTITIKVRKSSASPKYKPFETSAVVAGNVIDTWVSQEEDTIAT